MVRIWYRYHPEGVVCKQFSGYRDYALDPEIDDDVDEIVDMVYEMRSDRKLQMTYRVYSPLGQFDGVMATMLSDFQPTYSEFGKLIAD